MLSPRISCKLIRVIGYAMFIAFIVLLNRSVAFASCDTLWMDLIDQLPSNMDHPYYDNDPVNDINNSGYSVTVYENSMVEDGAIYAQICHVTLGPIGSPVKLDLTNIHFRKIDLSVAIDDFGNFLVAYRHPWWEGVPDNNSKIIYRYFDNECNPISAELYILFPRETGIWVPAHLSIDLLASGERGVIVGRNRIRNDDVFVEIIRAYVVDNTGNVDVTIDLPINYYDYNFDRKFIIVDANENSFRLFWNEDILNASGIWSDCFSASFSWNGDMLSNICSFGRLDQWHASADSAGNFVIAHGEPAWDRCRAQLYDADANPIGTEFETVGNLVSMGDGGSFMVYNYEYPGYTESIVAQYNNAGVQIGYSIYIPIPPQQMEYLACTGSCAGRDKFIISVKFEPSSWPPIGHFILNSSCKDGFIVRDVHDLGTGEHLAIQWNYGANTEIDGVKAYIYDGPVGTGQLIAESDVLQGHNFPFDSPEDYMWVFDDLEQDKAYYVAFEAFISDVGQGIQAANEEGPFYPRIPIVLVNGLYSDSADWGNLIVRIAEKTYEHFLPVEGFDFRTYELATPLSGTVPNDEDYSFNTNVLRTEIDQYLNELQSSNEDQFGILTPPGRISLISHSVGGLVARRFVSESGYPEIDRFVMLGVPNEGLYSAKHDMLWTHAALALTVDAMAAWTGITFLEAAILVLDAIGIGAELTGEEFLEALNVGGWASSSMVSAWCGVYSCHEGYYRLAPNKVHDEVNILRPAFDLSVESDKILNVAATSNLIPGCVPIHTVKCESDGAFEYESMIGGFENVETLGLPVCFNGWQDYFNNQTISSCAADFLTSYEENRIQFEASEANASMHSNVSAMHLGAFQTAVTHVDTVWIEEGLTGIKAVVADEGIEFAIISPTGIRIDRSSAELDPDIQCPATSDAWTTFIFNNSESGYWLFEFTCENAILAVTGYAWTVTNNNEYVGEFTAAKIDSAQGNSVVVTASLLSNGAVVVGTIGEATILDVFGHQLDAIELHDDGSSGDLMAGDGVLSSIYSPSTNERYSIITAVYEQTLAEPNISRMCVFDDLGINDYPVSTMLADYGVLCRNGSIEVYWNLTEQSGEPQCSIFRSARQSEAFMLLAGPIERYGSNYRYLDSDLKQGESYCYCVECEEGVEKVRLFTTDFIDTPSMSLSLSQNRPNPFNPSTEIDFYMPTAGRVKLEIFDVSGRRIICLNDEDLAEGSHMVVWDGKNARGEPAGSGIYFYRLCTGKHSISKKMVLLR